MDALQAAIQEVSVTASRLTNMLQGNSNGAHLSRHVSSVGEHVSTSYQTPPVPKRAETFAGFDSSSFDLSKENSGKKRYLGDIIDSEELNQQAHGDSDSEISHVTDFSYDRQSLPHNNSVESGSYDNFSTPYLLPGDHMSSIAQLAHSLHSIVHLTAKQGTAVESLRAQLAEANERINKLSVEVHDRKGGYRQHHQLEELRNLQEHIRREKQDLERQKEIEMRAIDRERSQLEEQKKQLEKEMTELASKKEDLNHQRQVLQKQIDMWKEKQTQRDSPLAKTTSSPGMVMLREKESGNNSSSTDPDSPNLSSHRRSASADFCQTIESDLEKLRTGQVKTTRRELPARPDQSRGTSLHAAPSFTSNVTSKLSSNKNQLPVHLLSAKNEQKTGGKAKQHSQFSQSVGGHKSSQGSSGVQQVLPFKLADLNSKVGGAVTANQGQMTTSQSATNITKSNRPQHQKSSSSSSLFGVMKLAEPGNKGKSGSERDSKSTAQEKPKNQKSGDGEIYF